MLYERSQRISTSFFFLNDIFLWLQKLFISVHINNKEKFPSIEHHKLVQQMLIYVSISWFSSPLPFLLDLCLSSRSYLSDIQCQVECFFTFSDRKLDSACLNSWCRHLHDGHYALLIVMEKSWIHTSLLQGSSLFLWLIIVLFFLHFSNSVNRDFSFYLHHGRAAVSWRCCCSHNPLPDVVCSSYFIT